jgi:hypothetical protein
MAVPLGIGLLAAVIVGIGIQVLDVSGSVAALCLVGLWVLAGILGGRAAEKWPTSSPSKRAAG